MSDVISVDIRVDDVCPVVSSESAKKLILALDLGQQDVDFTVDVIKELFKSLRNDLPFSDGKVILKQLKAINVECGE